MKKVVVSLFMLANIALVSCSKDLMSPADETVSASNARAAAAAPDTAKNKKPCKDSTNHTDSTRHERDSLQHDHPKNDTLKANKPPKDTVNQGGQKPKKKKGR